MQERGDKILIQCQQVEEWGVEFCLFGVASHLNLEIFVGAGGRKKGAWCCARRVLSLSHAQAQVPYVGMFNERIDSISGSVSFSLKCRCKLSSPS